MIRSILLVVFWGLIALCMTCLVLVALKGRKGALATLFGPIERKTVDFKSLQLTNPANQYLVCPEGYCAARAQAVAPKFSVPAERLQEAWFEMIAEQPATTVLTRDEPARQFDIETLTPLVGFPDTVTVRFIELGDGLSSLAIYSRSHYGRSDLGANKKRMDRWLEQLASKVGQNG